MKLRTGGQLAGCAWGNLRFRVKVKAKVQGLGFRLESLRSLRFKV